MAFSGKLNYSHFAKDENFFIVFPQGFSEHAAVFVFSTFTKNAFGVEKAPLCDITGTLLVVSDRRFEVRGTRYYRYRGIFNIDKSALEVEMYEGASTVAKIQTIAVSMF